ncbi:MAG: hypothetical protein AAB649_03150 [Patescibacteria group bacterium]
MILSRLQLRKISDICGDIAQVSLASIAVPYVINSQNTSLALLGFIITVAFWIFSLVLLNKNETL